jgi:hypothetical protein
MQIYYPSLQAIEQQTRQLDHAQCAHCQQTQQLVSHGFIRKKQVGAQPQAVGKRVFCSNRNQRTGCGRTVQLYLDSTVRYLHYAGGCVVAFLVCLIKSMTIEEAYHHATGAATPRNAYRWLDKLWAQLSSYRSLSHRPGFLPTDAPAPANAQPRRGLLLRSCNALLQRFGQPLCANYQRQLQRAFL